MRFKIFIYGMGILVLTQVADHIHLLNENWGLFFLSLTGFFVGFFGIYLDKKLYRR